MGMLVLMTLGLFREEAGRDFRVDINDMCVSLWTDELLLPCMDGEHGLATWGEGRGTSTE